MITQNGVKRQTDQDRVEKCQRWRGMVRKTRLQYRCLHLTSKSRRLRGICHHTGNNSRPESVTGVFFILAHNPELSPMETLKIYCPMSGRGGWGEDEIVGEEICEGENRKIKSRCGGSFYRTGVFGRGSVSQGVRPGLAGRLRWTQRHTDGRGTDMENRKDGMGRWGTQDAPYPALH